MRREIGVAKLNTRYRPRPVGVSRSRLQWTSKLPADRPQPDGASQSFLDANTPAISDVTCGIDDVSDITTVTPNSTSYFTPKSTQERRHDKRGERSDVYSRTCDDRKRRRSDVHDSTWSTSNTASSMKKTKRRRTVLHKEVQNKENNPSLMQLNRTPDVTELKRRFRAYSSSNSAQYKMLAIL